MQDLHWCWVGTNISVKTDKSIFQCFANIFFKFYIYIYIYIYMIHSFIRQVENLEVYNYMKLKSTAWLKFQRTKEKSSKILSNGPIYN